VRKTVFFFVSDRGKQSENQPKGAEVSHYMKLQRSFRFPEGGGGSRRHGLSEP